MGGQGQNALELLYEVHDCGYKYNFWEMATVIMRALVYGTTVWVDHVYRDGKVDQEPLAWYFACRTCNAETVRLSFRVHLTRVSIAPSRALGKICQWRPPPCKLIVRHFPVSRIETTKIMSQKLLRV